MAIESTQALNARLATIAVIHAEVVPLFMKPAPKINTLRKLFVRAKIPKFKANPTARRGGGLTYYHVPSVERLFRGMA